MSVPTPSPARRSIYLLPNLFTTGALFSGFYSIIASSQGLVEHACIAIFIAAIVVKVRDGQVRNRPFYAAIGVDLNGCKDVLGMWAGDGDGESAKYWMAVLTELRNRGVLDVFFVVCDGLKGLPDSVNAVFAQATEQIQRDVATGAALTSSMQSTGLFPSMVLQMSAIGEESGSLDHMLGKAADFYEAEVDEMVAGLSSLMEPIIIVVLGTIIGGIVVSMYLPIFKLGQVV